MIRIVIFIGVFGLIMTGGVCFSGENDTGMPTDGAKSVVRIDKHYGVTVDGEPFFPLGLFVVHRFSEQRQLDEIANSPFNTVMNYNVNNGNDAQKLAYLDALNKRGLKIIYSLKDYVGKGGEGNAAITNHIKLFKDHPALLAWYTNDELPPKHLSELETHYNLIKRLDKNHPVWSVHWNTRWLLMESHTTDIVGVDPYPIGNLPIRLVSRMADEAKWSGKPLWLVPQLFNWQDYPGDRRAKTGRSPTYEEVRAMTYLAVNHGATGLIYYSYFDIRNDRDFPERWIGIKKVAEEIDSLRPVIMSSESTEKNISCGVDTIDFKLSRKGNAYYLFAVNIAEEANEGIHFRLDSSNRGAGDKIDVLFENRTLPIRHGTFTDCFQSYEVHVYTWQDVKG